MGPTVSAMFGHAASHGGTAGPSSLTTVLALVLLAAATLAALVLRRRSGPGTDATPGRSRRGMARGLSRALGALGAPGQVQGPALRVLSRLSLGPGRYLCMVEAGSRVILVAVGGEVRLLGEVDAHLPRSRRARQAMARQLLVDRVAASDELAEAAAPPPAVELAPRLRSAAGSAEPMVPLSARASDEAAAPFASLATPVPTARTAALLERYLSTQAATAPGSSARDDGDDEAAAYFSNLLEASMARMEAAGERILRRGARPAPATRRGQDEGAAGAWAAEDAGL